jgi:hypothetical protein
LKKPDPFIYDQYYQISLGRPVTWDNPDIFIYESNVPVDPHDLQANTTYTVAARIWNNSTDVTVANLTVNFFYLSFGAGTKLNPIGQTVVPLGVKGLAGCPAFAYMDWTTPSVLGHYCIQVFLLPPDDSNWNNNLGQRNTDVTHPQSPAVFNFAVGNHIGPRTRNVGFTIDTYVIPPLEPCSERTTGISRLASLSKTAPPLPAGWNIALNPETLQLEPNDEQNVQAQITPPAGFSGSMPVNVTAWDEIGPVGGVTLIVKVP